MRLDFHVSNFNSFEFWVFFHFCLITQRYLALCDKLLLLQTNNGCKGDLGFEKGAAVVMCQKFDTLIKLLILLNIVVVVEWAPGSVPRAPHFLFQEPKGLPKNFLMQQPCLRTSCSEQWDKQVKCDVRCQFERPKAEYRVYL